MASKRRKISLINTRFQVRYSLFVCAWIFLLSLVYPLIIYNLFDFFIGSATIDPTGPSVPRLYEARTQILHLLIVLQALFMLITFLISIFTSHRIAGPVYKLMQYMRGAAKGRLTPDLHFRKGDHFSELADEYNLMVKGVNAGRDQAVAHIQRAMAQATPEARTELEKALASLRGSS
jgi:sensor histidine kinase YesM